MINFMTKKINIDLENETWQKIQNDIVLSAMKNNIKINPQNILDEARNRVVNDAMGQIVKQVKKEDPNCLISGEPHIVLNKFDKKEIHAEVKLTYYPYSELSKIDYKNLDFHFEYKKMTAEFLNAAFQRFISNYPLLNPVYDFVQARDVVEMSYKIVNNGKILEQKDSSLMEAAQTPNFTINNTLLGRRLNTSYTVNDPNNNNWTITIKKISRPIPTALNDKNVALLKIPGVNNLAQLRNKMFADHIKEHASNELLRYYSIALGVIENKNKFVYSVENLQNSTTEYIENYVKKEPKYANAEIEKILSPKNQERQEIINKANEFGRKKLSIQIVEYYIKTALKVNVSDDLASKELKHAKVVLNNSDNLTIQQMKLILIHQLVALNLAKVNHPQVYKQLSQDIKIAV